MTGNAVVLRRPSDRNLFLGSAILFPLLVLIGYFKSYYFSAFFSGAKPIANSLVHLHGIVMTLWVIYFTAQVLLVRTKNLKLHMTLGFAGIGLAALVIIVGAATAYDSHIIRHVSNPGIHPYSFFMIPITDLLLFAIFLSGAIYYRKRPMEHKTLMLMTAINFLAPALGRIPAVPPQYFLLWVFGTPCLIAIACLIWHSIKYRKVNKIFAFAVALFVIAQPIRIAVGLSQVWIDFVARVFG